MQLQELFSEGSALLVYKDNFFKKYHYEYWSILMSDLGIIPIHCAGLFMLSL